MSRAVGRPQWGFKVRAGNVVGLARRFGEGFAVEARTWIDD